MTDNRFPNADPGLVRRIKKHVTAAQHRFFTIVQPGLEQAGMQIFSKILPETPACRERGGYTWQGSIEDLYTVSLQDPIATRILMRLMDFSAPTKGALLQKCSAFPWELYINPALPLTFYITAAKSALHHTGLIEDILKKSIPAHLQNHRPHSQQESAQKIFVRNVHNRITMSIDTSGEPLYRRGYRTLIDQAPLRESTAAALLIEAGIENCRTLIDPMCGSGVFSIEAALMKGGKIPGGNRSFAFMDWPSHRPGTFAYILRDHEYKDHKKITIHAGDISSRAVSIARENIKNSGIEISVIEKDFFSHAYPIQGKTVIILNPPYGKRIESADTGMLYRMIGTTIRTTYADAGYCIIVAEPDNEEKLSLPWDKKIVFSNGGIPVAALIKFPA